jgi:hypothetical protein
VIFLDTRPWPQASWRPCSYRPISAGRSPDLPSWFLRSRLLPGLRWGSWRTNLRSSFRISRSRAAGSAPRALMRQQQYLAPTQAVLTRRALQDAGPNAHHARKHHGHRRPQVACREDMPEAGEVAAPAGNGGARLGGICVCVVGHASQTKNAGKGSSAGAGHAARLHDISVQGRNMARS